MAKRGRPAKKKEVKVVKAKKPIKVVKGKRGRPKKKTTYVAVANLTPLTPQAINKDQILIALTHVLEIFKASLYDAFRQYVENKLKASLPASLEEFINLFRHSFALHGVSEESLLDVLDDYERAYVVSGVNSLARVPAEMDKALAESSKAVEQPKTEAPKVNPVNKVTVNDPIKTDDNDLSVLDSLDIL